MVETVSQVDLDQAFCAAVWEALKGDHTDLRKQAIILKAHRVASEAHTLRVAEAVRDACATEAAGMVFNSDYPHDSETCELTAQAIRALDIGRIVEGVGRAD